MAFKPGQSGNPKGRPRKRPTPAEQAQALAPVAIERLAGLLSSPDDQAAAAAAAAILDLSTKKGTDR